MCSGRLQLGRPAPGAPKSSFITVVYERSCEFGALDRVGPSDRLRTGKKFFNFERFGALSGFFTMRLGWLQSTSTHHGDWAVFSAAFSVIDRSAKLRGHGEVSTLLHDRCDRVMGAVDRVPGARGTRLAMHPRSAAPHQRVGALNEERSQ